MKRNCGLWLALALVGCQPTTPVDTVESLVTDPVRLKEVQRQCKLDHAKVGQAACSAASEAYRRRFMGDGKVKYTPKASDQE